MLQRELLSYYRDEINRSKRWRSENYDDDWQRYCDMYRGRHYSQKIPGDQLIVNLVFSTINTIAPSVAVNNPKFVVNARKAEQAPQAIITEEVLNYLWRTYKYQPEFRLAVNDWLIIGHGWVKTGYKFVKPPEEKKTEPPASSGPTDSAADVGIDDREDVDGNVESEMYVYDDRPFIERMSPFDVFVDPDARHPKEMCWIAQRVWRPVQNVQVDSRYSPSARQKVSGSSQARWMGGDGDADARTEQPTHGARQYCEVIEFYDITRGKVSTFALESEDLDGSGGFLIKPKVMPYANGHPFTMLRGYEVVDSFYTLGDVAQIESLQLELNETRNQMMNHRKRFQRKWLYEKDAFDRQGILALESDVDNTMIPVTSDGNPSSVIAPLPAIITPTDFYDQSGLITNDIDRVSGVSDYQRGSAQTAVKRTATEAAMIQDAANSRAQDRLAKIEDVLAEIGSRIIALMQQFMTGEQVARVVTMPGRVWVPYDKDYITGDFDFEVAAGSTEPQNETFRRQSALQMVDASMPFLQMGVANPLGLYMYVLQKGFGVKDVGPLVMRPEEAPPAAGDPNAQQMQPGQEGAPPQQMNAPTQAPGDAPGQFPSGAVPPAPQEQQMMPQGMGPGPLPADDPMAQLLKMVGQQPQGPPPGGPEQLPPELLAQLMGQMPPQ
jgi:hypothetical protein